MVLRTKFGIGDVVWFDIGRHTPACAKVLDIRVVSGRYNRTLGNDELRICYGFLDFTMREEELCFKSRSALVKSWGG